MSLVHVYAARNSSDALLVQGLLTSEGLHPTLPGTELTDEFAQGRRMAGLLATNLYVPEEEAEKARDVLAAWEAKGEDQGEA